MRSITLMGTAVAVLTATKLLAVPASAERIFSGSHFPEGVAVSPGGTRVYLANRGGGTVSVFAAGAVANTTVGTVSVGSDPEGVAVSPDGSKVYVANFSDGTVSVIDTTTNPPTVSATISVGSDPEGVAVSPDGSKVFIANSGSDSVSVIQKNTVVTTINVGQHPTGVAVSPDGTKVYVANAIPVPCRSSRSSERSVEFRRVSRENG